MTREEFDQYALENDLVVWSNEMSERAIKALEYDDAKYHEEHGEVIVDKGLWEDAKKALEQEPKYCDRNICLRNEYNGMGCDECEVTKSQEPKTGHISIDDVMSVFDDFMCGEVDEDGMDTFLEMLKDKAESEG